VVCVFMSVGSTSVFIPSYLSLSNPKLCQNPKENNNNKKERIKHVVFILQIHPLGISLRYVPFRVKRLGFASTLANLISDCVHFSIFRLRNDCISVHLLSQNLILE
jgi:hypothetical protein